MPPGHLTQTNNARIAIGKQDDWFAPEAMTAYFIQLYSRVNDFDKAQIKALLYKSEMQYETAAKAFHLIDENTIPVIVNWKDSMNLVAQLRENGLTYRLMTRLLQYSVNVRRNDYLKLKQIGAIEEVLEDMFMISDSAFYDNEVGLITTNHWLEETLIL